MRQKKQGTKFQEILSRRKKSKTIRYILYFLAFLLIVWSIQSTIIEDTDWDRIGGIGSVIKAVAKFLPPDLSLFKHLVGPTVETFMIACLGTMLGIICAIPVAWMAALNVYPEERSYFAVSSI